MSTGDDRKKKFGLGDSSAELSLPDDAGRFPAKSRITLGFSGPPLTLSDDDGEPEPLTLDTAELFATYAELLDHLDLEVAALLGQDVIEDLANLNVNYAIALDGFADSSFTLRVDVAPVPLPAAAPLLLAAFGGAALFGRRRRCAA